MLRARIASAFAWERGKSSSETAGAPVGFSDFGWQHSRFCTAAFGSTFHVSWLAKLISEECIIWRLGMEGVNEA